MYCFLIYMSTKTQSSIDQFVSCCIHLVRTVVDQRSNLWRELKRIQQYELINSYQSLLVQNKISWCCTVGVFDIPYSSRTTQLVKLVSEYLNKPDFKHAFSVSLDYIFSFSSSVSVKCDSQWIRASLCLQYHPWMPLRNDRPCVVTKYEASTKTKPLNTGPKQHQIK